MKALILKFWRDPVWSKVISSGLLLFFALMGTWIFDLWPMIYRIMVQVWNVITYKIHIPAWLLALSIPFLIFLIPLIQSVIPDREPSFIKYKNDNILGINWSWEWASPNFYNEKYSIKNLHPRCPNCSSRLEINDYSGQIVSCINDECSWKWSHQGSFQNMITHSSQLNQKVHNIIDRKLFNSEYETQQNAATRALRTLDSL